MQFAVLLTWFADLSTPENARLFHAHERHMVELHQQGVLEAGGPFLDGKGSLLLLEVPDKETATSWLEADPAHGVIYRAQIHPWQNVFKSEQNEA